MENAQVEQLLTGGKKRKNKKKGGEQKEKENVKKQNNKEEEEEEEEEEENEPSGIVEPSSDVCGEICGDDTECFEVCNEAFRE